MTSLVAYLFAFLKSVIYGSTIFFTGELTETVDVLDILALRFLMSIAVMQLLKALKIVKIDIGVKDFFKKNPRSDAIKTILLTALFEPVLYMFLETLGISVTSNITAGVILSLMTVTTCLFEILILKEDCTLVQKLLLGLGIFGSIYIAVNTDTRTGKDTVAGIIILFLTTVAGSLFIIFSRKSSKNFAPMEVTYVSCLLGAVVFNAVNIVRHAVRGDILSYFDPYFDIDNLIGFFVLAVVSTIVATGMNNYALSKLKSSTVEAFGGVSTLVTVAVGVIFGGESLKSFHIIGLSFILIRMVGVSFISIRNERKSKRRDEEKMNDPVSR